MRIDSVGLFWHDKPALHSKASKGAWGPMPPIPDTGWTTPTEFPNLSAAKVIGLDTETYDPELRKAGPGWGRGAGHIIGVSLAVEDGTSWYFPMRHETEPETNMEPDNVLRWLDHVLADDRPKVGANLIYDIGWLSWEKVRVGGRLYDVQFAEALLNSEAPSVALDALSLAYLNKGKETEMLYQWLADWNGKQPTEKQRAHLNRTPPRLAGPYAEADAEHPIKILEKQWPLLGQRGVLDLFDIECRLIPLLVKMRLKGAPVNINKAEESYDQLGDMLVDVKDRIKAKVGIDVNPASRDSLLQAFSAAQLPVPTKPIARHSDEVKITFDKKALEAIKHPLPELILEHRKLTKVRDTFLKSYLMEKHVNNRVHTSFHPLKSDGNGARSGRFASSDPNLQNIPVRTKEGKLVRAAFDGGLFGNRWRCFDYSSIEYRLLVHYAVGPGAEAVRRQFRAEPDTDYHNFVRDLIKTKTSVVLDRRPVKGINFGIIYGMALPALAESLKLSRPKANKLLRAYHEAIPYARATMDAAAEEVHASGLVRTILSRASDFNQWGKKDERGEGGMTYELASRQWGALNIERKFTHKALNRKLQGSAADVMKLAMVLAYEAGLFEEWACGIPCLTVHDELDFEDKGDLDNPAWAELTHLMETCVEHLLNIPLRVDQQHGATWADTH